MTYLQYQAFLDDSDGFERDEWWAGLTKDYRKQEMREQRFKFANHPRDYVSWYQAITFCRWLSEKLGYDIRLPTEWEWQQAATGGDPNNAYPWGPDWDGSRANTLESGLIRTTTVGMYPLDVSPMGALDMSGNVWEWCLNEYSNPANTQLSGTERRVLRGGSWSYDRLRARAAARLNSDPGGGLSARSFRICCVRPPSL